MRIAAVELRREAARHDRADAAAAGCVRRATRRRWRATSSCSKRRLPHGGRAAGGHVPTYDACGVGNIVSS